MRQAWTRSFRIRLGVALVAAVLLAVGCGGNEETEAGASPLAEFLGEDVFGFDEFDEDTQARFAEEERVRQEKIAVCMKQEGFEYVPGNTSNFNFASSVDGLDYNSREYAEKYGFGITTERFSQEEVGPDLVGSDFERFEEPAADADPNNAVIEAMDEATREAYYEALYGGEDSFPSFDPETMTEEELDAMQEELIFEPQGCESQAFGEDQNNAFYREFDNELQEMHEAVQDDPRIKEREQEISECVAGKGYEFGGFDDDLFQRFESGLNEIETLLGAHPNEDLAEEDFAATSEEELEELSSQPREFSAEANALLAELQAEETELAVAVWDCGGGFAGDQELFREVAAEYEERFLADNADQLAQYKADR